MQILDHKQNRQIMTQKCFDNKTRMIVWTCIKKCVLCCEWKRACVSVCEPVFPGACSVRRKEFADQAALQGQSGDHTHIATHLPINTHTFKHTHTHARAYCTLMANICLLSLTCVCSPPPSVGSHFTLEYSPRIAEFSLDCFTMQ